MRVLLLNQYYHPDVAATAQLASDLGADLARRGHEVWALASARPYSGQGFRPLVERADGVRIVRVPATAFGRGSRLLRATDYATFAGAALAPLAALPRPDVVVALSTPPLVAALGLALGRLRRSRLVYWVMDVYPEVALALGAIAPGSLAARALSRLSRMLVRHADAVVALDDAMRERLLEAGAPEERVSVIDNWAPQPDAAPAGTGESRLRRELGLGDRFVVAYSGNMGLGHDFETLIAAMPHVPDAHFLFIGDGPRRAELERRASAAAPGRTTFLAYRTRDDLADSLAAADAQLVCLDAALAGLLAPSKLYGILAARRPLVYVGPPAGRSAEAARAGAGVDVRNGDARALASALRDLAADRGRRETMARRARELFEARFTRAHALERHHALLTEVAAC
jgi:glycosyltransferase involved in cell wall biosynthesis